MKASGLSREEVFITTKLPPVEKAHAGYFAEARGVPKDAKADDAYRSSLQLFYGLEQSSTGANRKLAQRYHPDVDPIKNGRINGC